MNPKYLILIGLAFLSGCCTDTNFKSYVMAHRLSYNANSLINDKLIQQNAAISEQDKATFKGKLDAEDAMITEAEKLLGLKK